MNLCKCGCNRTVSDGRDFIHGHNRKGHIAWNKGAVGLQVPWNKGKKTGVVPWNKGKKGLKGHIPWNKGLKLSQTIIIKISKALKGKVSPNKDKRMSLEQKEKISRAHKGKCVSEAVRSKISKTVSKALSGHIVSDESRKRMSDSHKGKPSCKKGVKLSEETIKKMSGENASNWKGGISFEPYCQKFNNLLKSRIRERDNHTCQLCEEKENRRKLDVHHIHYDKQNCAPDLITLCKSCNAKVNTNREYWEEYFMEKLEERGLLCSQNARSSQIN